MEINGNSNQGVSVWDRGTRVFLAAPQEWKTVDFKTGSASEIQNLLAAGASPNAKDQGGETPLDWATEGGRPEVVQALLAFGAHASGPDVLVLQSSTTAILARG